MSELSHSWNACPNCEDQLVDFQDEVFDGSVGYCWGCDCRFVAVSFTDDSWGVVPADDGEDDDNEEVE